MCYLGSFLKITRIYVCQLLGACLLQLNLYQENKIEESLVEAFIEFDRTLIADDTINRLKDLAKRPESPVPPNVLRLARSQTMEDDEDDDPDPDSAPVDCGKIALVLRLQVGWSGWHPIITAVK